MSERSARLDWLLLNRLLLRWREQYIWRMDALATIGSAPAATLGIYYVVATISLNSDQLRTLIVLVAVLVSIADTSGVFYAQRTTSELRRFLQISPEKVSADWEKAIWRETTTLPARVAIFGIINTTLIVIAPAIVIGITWMGIRPSDVPYMAVGSLVATAWFDIYYFFATEWFLWPVRRMLLSRSSALQQQYLAGASISTRTLAIYTTLSVTVLLMIGTLAYRKGEQALAPGANPVLVLQSMQTHVLVISLAIVLTSVIFSVLLSRSVANPIRRLTAVIAEVGKGNLRVRGEPISTDETGRMTIAFNEMVSQLETLQTGLEEQVAQRTAELTRRTSQLEAAAQVAREAASIRDPRTLLDEVVHLIADRFGFYHIGIFLLDDRGEYAVLQAASSEGGRRMLERGHRLAVGKVGIVGYVAGTGRPRIALDVGKDAVFFDNPDLPLTRSEMALPLRVGERVIGVLDVQSEEAAAFTEEDITILQTMADQIALAVENTRTLEQMQRTMQELERIYGEYTQEAWQATDRRLRRWIGRRYRHLTAELAEEMTEETRRALLEGRLVMHPVREKENGRVIGYTLAVPMRLRGQVIGAVNIRFAAQMLPSETVHVVEEIANRLALALENARLLEETRRHAERDRRIAEITARVRASMNPETILHTAAQELGAALGVDRVFVRIGAASSPAVQPVETGAASAAKEE